jgi:hypothetical protein
MPQLQLAIDMAETVTVARAQGYLPDIDAEATRLLLRHPEAHISAHEVAEVLREELSDPQR